jgi:hypothetical protein
MAQQPIADYPIDPVVTSGTQLADVLNRTNQVLNSGNSGPTRPPMLTAGGLWVKTGGATPELFMFDGTTDLPFVSSSDLGDYLPLSGGTVTGNLAVNGVMGVGTASPATDLDVVGPAGVTSFKGTTKLGVIVRGSTSATDYSGIDFTGNNQGNPTARIAVKTTGSGASLQFGTSNAYASGITTNAMTINDDGIVGIGDADPTDPIGFQAALDIKSSVGGAVYLRDKDVSTSYMYLGFIGNSGTTYLWSVANGPILFGIGNREQARLSSTGEFSLGKPGITASGTGVVIDDAGLIRITRSDTISNTNIQFNNNGGTEVGRIATAASATSYLTSSDYRLKENISPMTGALEKISALKPCTYTWKADGSAGQGFIAHELQAVVPDCVTGEKDAVEIVDDLDDEGKKIGTKEVPAYQGVDTSFLVATLVAAIQELSAKVAALEAK